MRCRELPHSHNGGSWCSEMLHQCLGVTCRRSLQVVRTSFPGRRTRKEKPGRAPRITNAPSNPLARKQDAATDSRHVQIVVTGMASSRGFDCQAALSSAELEPRNVHPSSPGTEGIDLCYEAEATQPELSLRSGGVSYTCAETSAPQTGKKMVRTANELLAVLRGWFVRKLIVRRCRHRRSSTMWSSRSVLHPHSGHTASRRMAIARGIGWPKYRSACLRNGTRSSELVLEVPGFVSLVGGKR
jgi:hypothetical protein